VAAAAFAAALGGESDELELADESDDDDGGAPAVLSANRRKVRRKRPMVDMKGARLPNCVYFPKVSNQMVYGRLCTFAFIGAGKSRNTENLATDRR
jgi:hypothetical protein